MGVDIVTQDDLKAFKEDLVSTISNLFKEIVETQTLTRDYLSCKEAEEFLHVSSKQFQIYRQRGQIPFSQFGRKIYVRRSDLEKFMEDHRISG